jgi:alkylated DNA repair dioxygenase AlkB
MATKIKLEQGDSYVITNNDIKDHLKLDKDGFQELWKLCPEVRPQIKIFGKMTEVPRYYQSYGKDYKFSGVVSSSLDVPPILQKYIDYANSQNPNYNFNGILVNWYPDGNSYIGFHSDDETQLVKESPIYCFSFGQKRRFILQEKKGEKKRKDFVVENNSYIVMGGQCQKYYKHSIPKITKKAELESCQPRISITLRCFK